MTADPTSAGTLARAEGMWASTITGWHYAMWGVTALGILSALTLNEITMTERLTAGAVFAGLFGLYLIGIQHGPWPGRHPRVYLAAAVVGVGLACGIHPTFSLLLFIVYPQAWLFTHNLRHGATVTALLTGAAMLGILNSVGFTWANTRTLAPQLLVSMGFSLMLGWWISRIIAQSVERAELIEELDRTRAALAVANQQDGIAQERARMAREIHDTLAQGFTSVVMLAQAAAARADVPEAVRDRLATIEDVARDNLAEARALVTAFSPADLDGAPLPDAVRRLGERFARECGVTVRTRVTDDLHDLAPATQVVALRAVQESLSNIRRHAGATSVQVGVERSENRVRLIVADDGAGFDPDGDRAGFGLALMRRRVDEVGGSVHIESRLGRGTVVRVEVPATSRAGERS